MNLLQIKSKITGKMQITIPKSVCETLDLKVGDYITYEQQEDGKIVIDKISK